VPPTRETAIELLYELLFRQGFFAATLGTTAPTVRLTDQTTWITPALPLSKTEEVERCRLSLLGE
jgi:hypothetical protein